MHSETWICYFPDTADGFCAVTYCTGSGNERREFRCQHFKETGFH